VFAPCGSRLCAPQCWVGLCQDWFIKSRRRVFSERSRPNTANPEGLVRNRYIAGKEGQTSSDIRGQVSNR
jgi:hypothetical protein